METKKNIEDAKLPRKYAGQYNLQMASLYHERQRNDTALHYARQALADFFADGNQRDVQLTRIMLFMAYADKQQADSANYYMKRAKEHINDVEEYERAPFYATLGGWIAHNDTALAKSYLVRSIDIMPNYRAYRNLATLYAKTGQQQQAIDTWKLAATTKDKMLRMNAMQQLYALQHGADDYEAACQTAMQMVNLQDSLAKEKNIDSAKQEYDTSASRFKQKFFLYLSLLAMAIFSVIITILFVVMVRKYKRTSRKLSDAEKEVNRLCILLTATRQGIKDGKEAEEPSAPQKDIIALNGKLLMDEICQGGTTVRWTRSDFDDAANYCHTLDADFIDCLRARNPQLSSRYIVFAYLKHIGKSDAQLRHALVISQSTIRSYRSRIKQ